MGREHDLIISVKHFGVVVAEVKNSSSHDNIPTAEKQVANYKAFVQHVMQAITGTTMSIAKLIFVPAGSW